MTHSCLPYHKIENGTEASFAAVFNAFTASIMNWFDEIIEVLSRESLASLARETIHSLSSSFTQSVLNEFDTTKDKLQELHHYRVLNILLGDVYYTSQTKFM